MEDPGKKLGQVLMLRKRALARARQIRLRRMKLGKKNPAKLQRVMRGPEPPHVETVAKVDPPFMPHDVTEPAQVPRKRVRVRNNGGSDLGVCEEASFWRDKGRGSAPWCVWALGRAKRHMRGPSFRTFTAMATCADMVRSEI